MDWIDKLLIASARKHMIHFELGEFKKDFPSLYHTIRDMMFSSLQHKS